MVPPDAEAPLSFGRLLCVCMWTIGVTFGFNAEFVLGTPLFVSLGSVMSASGAFPLLTITHRMSPVETSFAWLAGPLSGLIVQPIIGSISDGWEGRSVRGDTDERANPAHHGAGGEGGDSSLRLVGSPRPLD